MLYADTPFLTPETIERLRAARMDHDVVVLGFEAADPGRYGRLVMEGDALMRIVEAKDATTEELAITTCNSGVMAANAALLMGHLGRIAPQNAAGEYYLTDVVALARAAGQSAGVVLCPEDETLGRGQPRRTGPGRGAVPGALPEPRDGGRRHPHMARQRRFLCRYRDRT